MISWLGGSSSSMGVVSELGLDHSSTHHKTWLATVSKINKISLMNAA